MKRYGDNLPSKDEDEPEDTHQKPLEVLRGGCGVRYEILDYLLGTKPDKKRPAVNIFSFVQPAKKEESKKP